MELTEGSQTSANHNLTPGKYPKEYIKYKFTFEQGRRTIDAECFVTGGANALS
jgi:hypothetical protein